MSNNNLNDQNIDNAAQIIERFGGLRPMAKKTGVAVTTIQGWKKRDSIPAGRKEQIIKAAQDYKVDLSGLLPVPREEANEVVDTDTNTNTGTDARQAEGISTGSPVPVNTSEDTTEAQTPAAAQEASAPIRPSAPKSSAEQQQERRQAERRSAERRAAAGRRTEDQGKQKAKSFAQMNKSYSVMSRKTWIFVIVSAAIAGVVLLGLFMPVNDKAARNADNIQAIEAQIKETKEKRSVFKAVMPQELRDSVASIKDATQDIQRQVSDIKEKTAELKETTQILFDEQAGTLTQRLGMLEDRLTIMSAGSNLQPLMARMGELQNSLSGQDQLQSMVDELLTVMRSKDVQDASESQESVEPVSVADALRKAQQQEEGALSDTLAGVEKTDLKAAAYLLALGKFRDTTRRGDKPLTEDLELIYRLVDKDDVALRAAIEKLAPKAEQGVLTPTGLSSQFKGIAGELVVASLTGEDVSIKDRANARLHDVLKVEKDGEMLTGTDTQAIVARAQKQLDAGDVEAALATLKALEGEAANKAQPFMDEAQKTIVTQQIQALLGDKIVRHFERAAGDQGGQENMLDGLMGGIHNFENMKNPAANMMGGGVVRDNQSGVSILPRGPNLPQNLKSILPKNIGGRQPIRLPTDGKTYSPAPSEPSAPTQQEQPQQQQAQ